MTDRTSIKLHFAKSSALYEQEALLQRIIAGKLMADFAGAGPPCTILDVGCGTGFLTEQLVRLFPAASITAVDLAGPMLETLRAKLNDQAVTLVQADAASHDYRRTYDLIVSSSSMQWMVPLKETIRHLSLHLSSGGTLLFALMLHGTFDELHKLRRALFPAKPPRASLPSAAEVEAAITAAGLALQSCRSEEFCQPFESAVDFLRTIKNQGFTGGPLSLGEKPLTRGELSLLLPQLERAMRNGEGGGIAARYVVGFYRTAKRCV